MFCVAYRFHPLEEDDAAFIACWKEMTQLIESELGGLGSRLHRTEDGDLYAYAQWPDRASWERMWETEETGRMAELSAHWRELAGPSEIVFAGDVVEDLHRPGGT
ncbi:MAG: antibiotic biosynthesis monooxygenase [Gammaproteobacteria bacterium]|jgi:quinol monooxygenase YgiN